MDNIIYGIERWHEDERMWRPCRFGGDSLEEMAEAMQMLEDTFDWEVRLAQYLVSEFQMIRSFG